MRQLRRCTRGLLSAVPSGLGLALNTCVLPSAHLPRALLPHNRSRWHGACMRQRAQTAGRAATCRALLRPARGHKESWRAADALAAGLVGRAEPVRGSRSYTHAMLQGENRSGEVE